MPQFLLTWIITSASLLITAYLIPGITITSISAAAVAAIVLGLVNAFVKPLLVLFTLPLTVLTLGLFLLVVNAISFSIVGYFTPGVEINSFLDALFGSIVISLVSGFLNQFFNDEK
ncbi:MAG: phage holin family protein [Prochloraceae cyanobacterium]|nr:phage holin family protein [Prochloraceae cyanobacterium]